MIKQIPILVNSYDGNRGIWNPFFTIFFNKWGDCPFRIHLISNFVTYHHKKVNPILAGNIDDYSAKLIFALDQIDSEWVIYWDDDRPPAREVNTSKMLDYLDRAIKLDAGYFKLVAKNLPPALDGNRPIGEVPKGTMFRVSMTIALWKKTVLLKVLKEGDSPWDIESRGGARRADAVDDKFYALSISEWKNAPLVDKHLLTNGKFIKEAIPYLKQHGVYDDLSPIRTISNLVSYAKKSVSTLKHFYYKVKVSKLELSKRLRSE